MEGFVEDYLATVTSDLEAAWAMLTPQFQEESGASTSTRASGAGSRARLISAEADPASGQITYTVEYQLQDGSKTRDDVTLTLDGSDGAFRIAGES